MRLTSTISSALGSLSSVYSLASHPTDPNTLLVALGANGTAVSTTANQSSAQAAWTQLSAGEAGTVAIDQASGNIWLLQSGAGVALHTCSKGKSCSPSDLSGSAIIGAAQTSNDSSLFDPPALLDPNLASNLLVGTCRVWRGPSQSSTWTSSNAISPFLSGSASPACNSSNAYIRALAAGGLASSTSAPQTSGSQVLYAALSGTANGGGAAGGHLYATTTANLASGSLPWTDLARNAVTNDPSGFNPGGFDISSIAIDPADPTGSTVYATVQGFGNPHIYRSTNAGSSWTNISANLPNAPANAVVVDPNNAKVVYIAMDTGVYVASDVTTCVSSSGVVQNCWAPYGTSLPTAPAISLVASASISSPASLAPGVLRVGTFGRGVWQIPLVSAGSTAYPVATFSPSALNFAAQTVGTTSTPQSVTLTNTGSAAMTISAVTGSTGFLETDSCLGATLPVGSSCAITVSFAPVSSGDVTGTIQVSSNVSGGVASLSLHGTGIGIPLLTFTPSSVTFAAVPAGTISPAQTVVVTNSGTATANLSVPATTQDYAVPSTTCGSSLSIGATCSISIVFSPTVVGANSGLLTLADGTVSYTAPLSGVATGNADISVTPSSLDFSSGQPWFQNVTVTNHGFATAAIGTPILSSPDWSIFWTSDCYSTLAPNSSCTLIVDFSPTNQIVPPATLTIPAAGSTYVVELTGTGQPPRSVTMSPTVLTFPATDLNTQSASQTLTLSAPDWIYTFDATTDVSGDFAVTANSCYNHWFGYDQNCTLTVVFNPTAAGPRTGILTYKAYGTTTSAVLTGTGIGNASVTVSPAALSFPATNVGSSSLVQTITVTNSGTTSSTLNGPVFTGDFSLASSTCGASLSAGSSCVASVLFAPTAAGMRVGTATFNDASGTQTVSLTGNGVGVPNVTIAPSSLAFPSTSIGSVSLPQSVTLTNSGSGAAALSAPSLVGDFTAASSTCGNSLAAGASCAIAVSFKPTQTGTRAGNLTVYDASTPHTVMLSGSGTGTANVSAGPGSLVFPATALNTSSAAQSVTFSNSGTAASTLTVPTITGDFAIQTNTCGASLAPNSSCSVGIAFVPAAVGARSGTLTIADSGATHTIALSGTGTGSANITVSPAGLSFPATAVHASSTAQTITVSNSGNITGTLAGPTITGDFLITSNTCGASVAASGTCTLAIAFAPSATGTRTGSAVFVTPSGNQVVSLTGSGTGTANVTLAPSALVFTAAMHTTSAAKSITVSNSGNTSTSLTAPTITGDFSLTSSTCGSSLAANAACILGVSFSPSASGTRTGSLTLADTASMHTVALTGTVIMGVLAPSATSITFPNTVLNTTSAAQMLTVTNTGAGNLAISSNSVTGDFAAGNGCSGTVLAPGKACTAAITFTPKAVGARTGILTLTSDSGGNMGTSTVALAGNSSSGVLTTSASSISFPDTTVNATSGVQSLVVSNTGSSNLTISGVGASGDFAAGAGCTGAVVTPGTSCTIALTFTPKAVGARTGALTLTSDSGGTTGTVNTVALSGNGKGTFTVVLQPTSVNYGSQIVGTTSAVTNITISDTGTASGALQSIAVSGDFRLTANTCGATLAPQTGCTVSVVFAPTVTGTRTGSLTVVDDAGTQTAALTGNGTSAATDTLSPLSLVFPSTQVSTTSTAQSVTLTNSGDTALTLVSAQILSGDFTVASGCGPTLAAHSSCTFAVTFAPRSVGSQAGTLQVSDVQHIQTVALSGTATAGPGVSLTPGSLTFAATGVGVASAGQTLTLTNNGGTVLQLTAINVTGDFGVVSGTNTCSLATPVAVGGSCSLQVAFVPTAAGARTGTLTVQSNAATQTAQLAGTGVDFTLAANGPASLTTTNGSNAVYSLLLRPVAYSNNPVTYTCTGIPANSKCTVVAQYTDLSAISTVTVTVLTGVTPAARVLSLGWLLPLLGLPLWAVPRRAQRVLLAMIFSVLVFGAVSCGAGRSVAMPGTGTGTGGGGTTPVTPSGTYTVTVSATAAGVTHSVQETLVVQ